MSKILVLADIHGRTLWKDIINIEHPDVVIFLGDYVTTHEDISPEQQLSNLEDILNYKEENWDTVDLLIGNHDLCELGYYWAECNPNEPKVREVMSVDPLKSRFLDLTQWVSINEDLKIIFSHAGISQVWMDNSNIKSVYDINKLTPSEIFGFTPNHYLDFNGNSETQPPVWIRPQALCKCNVEGWNQVIGHTPVKNRIWHTHDTVGEKEIWFCDALSIKQYLIIDHGKFQPKYLTTNE